ncbi:hypothetical protein HR45_12400 [Shewanella mangrovi]|uniref:TonB-dependent receptor n=1 Tax=Shewanella mangrovi TaxID=1515746 RepID=A0A094JD79_9GAMM|nr:TonB-dependent siderophore receptor [Shewanella mangrovi]KFZ37202.1 hypothetical protein HR45_12400 [Shewanella mangrovi]
MSFVNTSVALAIAIAAALGTNVAYADDASRTNHAQIEKIEVIGSSQQISRSATGLNMSLRETPQSVSVISNEYIENFNLNTINDVMDFTPGITVEKVETDRTYLTSRGFTVSNIQIDGVGAPFYADILYGDTDTSIYEQVDVIRGANGLAAGVGNPAATVNLIRKRPTQETQGYVKVSAGRWDNYGFETDVSGSLTANVRGRFVGSYHDNHSYIDLYSKQLASVYGVLEADISDSTLLTVGAHYSENKPDSPMWGSLTLAYTDGTPTDFGRSTSTSADWAYWNTLNTEAFAELKHNFANGWTGLVSYNYRANNQAGNLFYVTGSIAPVTNSGLYGYASRYTLDGEAHQVDAKANGDYQLFGRTHQLTLGASWIRHSVKDLSLFDYTTGNGFPNIDDFTQWDGNTPFPTFADNASGSDISDTQASAYIATRIEATDKLSFVAGGRFVDYRSRGESYGNQEVSDENKFIPYGGIVYDLTEHLSLYTSIAKTFRAQTEFDEDHQRLAPTSGKTLEGGIKGEFFNGALNTTAAIFKNEYQNLAETAGRNAQGQSYSRGVDLKSTGFELEISGKLSDELKMMLGYTQLDIEDQQGDDIRPYIPERSLKGMLIYQPEWAPELSLGTNFRWQSSVYTDVSSEIRINQGAYAIYGVFAKYQILDNLELGLNVSNLGDKTYYNSLRVTQAFYGAPRDYTATITYRF